MDVEISWSDDVDATSAPTDAALRLADASASTPFSDPEVLAAWLDTTPPERIVRFAEASVDGERVGLLAIAARRSTDGSPPTHWHLWGEHVDFGVVWADSRHAHGCWRGWIEGLRSRGAEVVRLRNVRMVDPAISSLFELRDDLGVATGLLDRRRAPFVDLTSGFDAWLAGRTKSQRRQYRRALRTFRTVPGLTLDFLREPSDVADALQVFFDLHRSRRADLDRTSVYDDDGAAAFLRALVPRWAERGRIGALLASGIDGPIGVELVITTPTTWYSLNGGWLGDFARFHVGTGLLLEAMLLASAEGVRRYSLLEGEEPYKLRMATGGHQLASWDLHLNAAR